jgi:succinylglutamic semialdehyde dehydrogenase
MSLQKVEYKGNYIAGEFIKASGALTWEKQSPADLKDIVFEAKEQYDHVEKAIAAAREAYNPWRKLSMDERKNHILRLKEVYLANKEKIAELISRETGKPYWETLGEAAALASKIDITLNESLKLVAEQKVANALPNVDGYVRFKPRGVMAVIGPFNFPAHLPNGHIIPALITGNTVVLKPSEVTPATGQLLAEMFHQAGFPRGVFNMVQGRVETGKRLVKHEHVDGVLFTGSYDVGLKISQDLVTHYGKLLALEMGGKNATIVWEDADIDKAVYECIFGSYASTGQRCSCTSRIIVHKKIKDVFMKRFHETAKKIKIGHWKEDVFFGPLIHEQAVEKYLRFQEIALREGAESVMRGKVLEMPHKGFYVSPSIYFINTPNPASVFEKEEVFGPCVAVYAVDDLDEAIRIVNDTSYGLAASIFTKDRANYLKTFDDLQVGNVNWNRATCGASSKLPFGGEKKSGNDRPSGNFAVYYCTTPISCLEDQQSFDPKSIAKGIELK